MSKTFADFPLAEQFQSALIDLGFTTPTAVQAEAVPAALEGKDLLVSSQTGSGKTVAFLLPTLNPLASATSLQSAKDRMKSIPSPNVLVLCPTRELAQQVSQDAIALVRHVRGVRIATVVGGMPFAKQISQLRGAQVLVATPGRLLDLVNRRQLSLAHVDALIVDEADRMLDLGFSEDLEAISDLADNRKQTLMFSATFADRIIRLAEKMTNNAVRIAIETGHSTNADIEQTLHWTDGFEHKKKLLAHWLNDETMDQAVIFASTQEDTDLLAEHLAEAGHSVVALHGAMPQTVRNRRIRSLREGRARVLVATDVAARGLDVPAISHVINFGLPMKNEDYVHRIGRTGRAGRSGRAITLAMHRERGKVRSLEEYLNARIAVTEIAGLEPTPAPERPRGGAGRGERSGGRSFGGGAGRGGFGGNGGGRRVEGEKRFSGERSGGRDFKGGEGFKRDDTKRFDYAGERAPRPFGDANRDGAKRFDGGGERRPRFSSDRDDNRGNRDDNRGNRDDNRGNRSDFRSDRPQGAGRDGAPRFAGAATGERRPRPEGQARFSRDGERGEGRPFRENAGRSFNREEGGRSFGAPAAAAPRFDAGERRPRRQFEGERSFGGERAGGAERPHVEHKTRRFKDQAFANKPRRSFEE